MQWPLKMYLENDAEYTHRILLLAQDCVSCHIAHQLRAIACDLTYYLVVLMVRSFQDFLRTHTTISNTRLENTLYSYSFVFNIQYKIVFKISMNIEYFV